MLLLSLSRTARPGGRRRALVREIEAGYNWRGQHPGKTGPNSDLLGAKPGRARCRSRRPAEARFRLPVSSCCLNRVSVVEVRPLLSRANTSAPAATNSGPEAGSAVKLIIKGDIAVTNAEFCSPETGLPRGRREDDDLGGWKERLEATGEEGAG